MSRGKWGNGAWPADGDERLRALWTEVSSLEKLSAGMGVRLNVILRAAERLGLPRRRKGRGRDRRPVMGTELQSSKYLRRSELDDPIYAPEHVERGAERGSAALLERLRAAHE